MLTTPFLTNIDPQAAVKGSRDPLGVQAIWSRLGRHVVGNLTTVSTSPRDFTTTILGYYFAERIAGEKDSDGDLNVFLRWEQLAGHARYRVNGDGRLRGIERVKRCWNEGGKIRLAADASGQILSNQKTYGLWGLYTGPARASGLLMDEPTRLSPAARELVEQVYLPAFTAAGLKNGDRVVELLAVSRSNLDYDGKDQSFLKGVGKVLAPTLTARERGLFREHLLLGRAVDQTEGRQDIVATILEESLTDGLWENSPAAIRHLAKRCRTRGPAGIAAAERLENIRAVEQLLAPATALFDLVLGSDGQPLPDLAGTVKRQWGGKLATVTLGLLEPQERELRDTSGATESGERWIELAKALSKGGYDRAIELLLAQNASVMKLRGSAGPWVELDRRRIRVKYRDDNLGDLPARQDLSELWRHSYFLDALGAMAHELRT